MKTSVSEYHLNTSCYKLTPNIRVPTLVIHARDDPIIHIDCMPLSAIVTNPNFIVAITDRGGHVQYFDGCEKEKGLAKYLYGQLIPNDRWFGKACNEYIQFVDKYDKR